MSLLTTLNPTAPYNFRLTWQLIDRAPTQVMDVSDAQGHYWRALHLSDGLALVRVDADLQVHLMAASTPLDAAAREALVQQVEHVLAIETDMRPFYTYARLHPELWSLVDALRGLRMIRAASVFEALVCVIMEQHIAWSAALKAQRHLVEWGGQRITHEGVAYYAFPTANQLAAADPADLQQVTRQTHKRIAAVLEVAQAVASGTLDLEALYDLPHSQAYQRLMALRGVGHWTAANVLARTQGRYAYIPDADAALQAAALRFFIPQAEQGARKRLSQRETRTVFAAYGEYGPAAAYYTLFNLILSSYQARHNS